MSDGTTPAGPAGREPATQAQLALDRTRYAVERTTMAWIRTANSLIIFGFAVYKTFQLEQFRAVHGDELVGPRGFAIALISIGIAALSLATVHHVRAMRELRIEYRLLAYRQLEKLPSLSGLVSALLTLLGLGALILAVLRQ